MKILLSDIEANIITNAMRAVSGVPGDVVEIGVFEGGSAELICKEKGTKKLHLFDTWEGIVSTTGEDKKTSSNLSLGRYKADIEPVRQILDDYDDVYFHKGEFPETYIDVGPLCLIHIDVDLYFPTKEALRLFWDKLSVGGIVILHDYPSFEGVRMAIDEVLEGEKFTKLQITKEQAVVIKIA